MGSSVTRPLVAGAATVYGAFVGASILSLAAWRGLGSKLILAWPYPFLLSLQHVLNPTAALSFALAYIAGFAVVLCCAFLIQGWIGRSRPHGLALVLSSAAIGMSPVVILQAVVRLVWTYGE